MGTNNSKVTLTNPEIDEYSNMTSLNAEEIVALHAHFKSFSTIDVDDGVIDYKEFCIALNIEDSLIGERIFSIFDDKNINFTKISEKH